MLYQSHKKSVGGKNTRNLDSENTLLSGNLLMNMQTFWWVLIKAIFLIYTVRVAHFTQFVNVLYIQPLVTGPLSFL